ncbi:hypothetical protein J2T14_004532 [Paenibacillus harenae]|nr:hypothetical protein [Paenibacillus harenae]
MEKVIISLSIFPREVLERYAKEVEANKDKHKHRKKGA